MSIFHTLRDGLETLVDTRKLTQVRNIRLSIVLLSMFITENIIKVPMLFNHIV